MRVFLKVGLGIFLFCSSAYARGFDPESVRLVDQEENVCLFRGNLPLQYPQCGAETPQFAYDELISKCGELLSGGLPREVELYDICLLTPEMEDEISVERSFFEDNPSLGKFIHHPILGCALNPSTYEEQERRGMLNCPFEDGLKDLVHSIRHDYMRNIPQGKVRVLYVHCCAGNDHTGVVAGSYLMHYAHVSFQKVKEINTEVASRSIAEPFENELEWYAYYLKDVEKIRSVGPIDQNDSDGHIEYGVAS